MGDLGWQKRLQRYKVKIGRVPLRGTALPACGLETGRAGETRWKGSDWLSHVVAIHSTR